MNSLGVERSRGSLPRYDAWLTPWAPGAESESIPREDSSSRPPAWSLSHTLVVRSVTACGHHARCVRPPSLAALPRAPPEGPYRESFAEYCSELQSDRLPLFIRCPNAVNDVGINREKWVPNPTIDSGGGENGARGGRGLHLEMLSFLGRLMGVAIRSNQPLDLDFPSIVWKQLVRSPITV